MIFGACLYTVGILLSAIFWTADAELKALDDPFYRARILRSDAALWLYKTIKITTLYIGAFLLYFNLFKVTFISCVAFVLFIGVTRGIIWILGNGFGYIYYKYYHIFSFMIPLKWVLGDSDEMREDAIDERKRGVRQRDIERL